MGSGQSSTQREEPRLADLLEKWPSQEQLDIRAQYERIQTDVNKSDGPIPAETFKEAIARLCPTYYVNELSQSVAWFIRQDATNITFQKFMEASVNLLVETDEVAIKAVYAIFRQSKVSLETFVLWVVLSAVPAWFEGTGWQQPLEMADQEQRAAAVRLVHFLVHRTHNEQQRERQRRLEEERLWMGAQNDVELEDTWKNDVTKMPSELDSSMFSAWIRDTPSFLKLFTLAVELIFFGHPNNRDMHKRRVERRMAPGMMFTSKKQPFSRLLTAYDYFMLTLYLPVNALSWSPTERNQRRATEDLQHRLLFSSRKDGTSWQVFVNRLVNQGATLIVIKAKDGSIFGAYADEAWKPTTDWYGNGSNFLFRLNGTADNYLEMGAWYGLAMGGQFDYCGLWLAADFLRGHSRAGPLCSTYGSPQLSRDENFEVDEVEVWLVRPRQRDDDEEGMEAQGSALDRAEDMEFLEMAGKKMYSKDLGPGLDEEEEQEEEEESPDQTERLNN
ncbi:hypothetical protein EC973_002943 [Apophysomyces ossiformis]|uniref:MTOR-associated protein MEAK7 n=1 Tax=Apophysomyces ossiformis TaxID=679940 RepID=A0A8H7ENB9_9FUNG|nr:hypothetical protein EC973_002943 [Apophysomyces ossiformis]